MLKLAWRNLTHERTRLIISMAGVAFAVLLILVMSGIFAGGEEQATAYIRNQPALLWSCRRGWKTSIWLRPSYRRMRWSG